jgi:hypothetical protein
MCGSLIIGSFFLLAGISIFINIIFGINIPFGRIFWGLVLLYLGIMLITGTSRCRMGHNCGSKYRGSAMSYSNWAGSADISFDVAAAAQSDTHPDFSTVMGSTDLDLSQIKPETLPANRIPLSIDISTVFGKTIVKISKDTPVRIDVRSAFAGTELPDHTNISFGSHTYVSHQGTTVAPLHISTSTVFGGLEIVRV